MVFIVGVVVGCNSMSTGPAHETVLTATFALADTTGKRTTTFHSGDQFDMFFTLKNTMEEALTFHYTLPPVYFQILQYDSVIASSIDGYTFPAIVLGGSVAPGEALSGSWRAPTTPAQEPRVILAPGVYQANVIFSTFDQVRIKTVAQINFLVVPK